MRGTGNTAGADLRKDTEQVAGYGIVTVLDKWYNGNTKKITKNRKSRRVHNE